MIPIETLQNCDIVATYKLQDVADARSHRDRLKAEGKTAVMIRSEGRGRYDGAFHVLVPKSRKSATKA